MCVLAAQPKQPNISSVGLAAVSWNLIISSHQLASAAWFHRVFFAYSAVFFCNLPAGRQIHPRRG